MWNKNNNNFKMKKWSLRNKLNNYSNKYSKQKIKLLKLIIKQNKNKKKIKFNNRSILNPRFKQRKKNKKRIIELSCFLQKKKLVI